MQVESLAHPLRGQKMEDQSQLHLRHSLLLLEPHLSNLHNHQ
jgi:hypothetical protein